MPVALDPKQTFEISLRIDEELPAAERPVFVYRFAAAREARRMSALYEKVMAAEDDAEMPFETTDQVFEQLQERLVGWRNMIDPATGEEIPFEPADLDRLLTLTEAFALLARVCTQGPDAPEKKRSSSPSECSGEKSAEDAGALEAATTPPASSSPSMPAAQNAKGQTTKPTSRSAATPAAVAASGS